MHWLWTHFQIFFAAYGLWAVCTLLLLENAGLPLPGETALLYAGFLAHQHKLAEVPLLIVAAIAACTLGDNLGYWVGRKAGLRLRRWLHLRPARVALVARYFETYGDITIFFARFIAGLRIIAGPAAGLNHMPWRTFLMFNALGAAAWVSVIVTAGYLLGQQWQRLVSVVGKVDVVFLLIAAAAVAYAVRRLMRRSHAS
jgi:membrane-associated protein